MITFKTQKLFNTDYIQFDLDFDFIRTQRHLLTLHGSSGLNINTMGIRACEHFFTRFYGTARSITIIYQFFFCSLLALETNYQEQQCWNALSKYILESYDPLLFFSRENSEFKTYCPINEHCSVLVGPNIPVT